MGPPQSYIPLVFSYDIDMIFLSGLLSETRAKKYNSDSFFVSKTQVFVLIELELFVPERCIFYARPIRGTFYERGPSMHDPPPEHLVMLNVVSTKVPVVQPTT